MLCSRDDPGGPLAGWGAGVLWPGMGVQGQKGSLPPVDVDALAAKTDLIILTQVRSPQLLQNPSQSTSLYCHDSNLDSSQC